MTKNGDRFARLFKGHGSRYGRYDITGDTVAEEKVAGKARTVDQQITLKDYNDHVAGKVGIGVIPLQGAAKEQGMINFAAIDIDVYKQDEKEKRNLTHEDIALALMETPLIVTKSKSGGIHVWMFSKEGIPARIAIEYLNAQASHLGVGGCEVFPKQTERFSDEDVGNWINLPYFGGHRVAVVPSKTGSSIEYIEPDLDQFLDIAESVAETTTSEFILDNMPTHINQRADDKEEELFYDGPPCLQRMIIGDPRAIAKLEDKHRKKLNGIPSPYASEAAQTRAEAWLERQKAALSPQNIENNRNNVFFCVGMYLHRRLSPHDPDAKLEGDEAKALGNMMTEIHTEWRMATGNKGIQKELTTLSAQGVQGKWGYKCTQEPLKSYCDRRLCHKRKFGVGTGAKDSPFAITGFTIVESEERQYYLTVGDKRIHIPDAASLFSQATFAQHVLNQTDRMWRQLQDPKYKELMDVLLEKADRIDPPPDSDSVSIIRNNLYDFVHDLRQARGQNDTGFFQGRVLVSEDEKTALFKLDQFEMYLRGRGYTQFTTRMIAKKLIDDLNVVGRGNTEIAGRQVRPYEVNLANLELLMSGGVGGAA